MTEATTPRTAARRSFGRTVALGLASAVVLTWAGHQPFARLRGAEATLAEAVLGTSGGELPLVGALALVTLAGWGVLLVTRGRVRRVTAAVAAVTGAGATVLAGYGAWAAPGQLADRVAGYGYDVDVVRTVFPWLAVLAGLGCVVAGVVAVLRCRDWPEMGAAYDAPAAGSSSKEDPLAGDNRDIWKALDEGRDPTSGR